MLQRTIAGRMNDDIRAQLKLVALGYLVAGKQSQYVAQILPDRNHPAMLARYKVDGQGRESSSEPLGGENSRRKAPNPSRVRRKFEQPVATVT
jgi:hypothetical protein